MVIVTRDNDEWDMPHLLGCWLGCVSNMYSTLWTTFFVICNKGEFKLIDSNIQKCMYINYDVVLVYIFPFKIAFE